MMHPSFLDPTPPSSPLADVAPPGPAAYRREWCRLEELGATEYVDRMSPRPGIHVGTVESTDGSHCVVACLGGRRARALIRDGMGDDPGASVRISVVCSTLRHFVTPAGFHVVGSDSTGWTVYAEVVDALLAAGSAQAEVIAVLRRAGE